MATLGDDVGGLGLELLVRGDGLLDTGGGRGRVRGRGRGRLRGEGEGEG